MARHVRGQDVNAQACIRILGQLALAELRRLSYGFCCECGSTSQASRLKFSRIAAALRICAPSAVDRDEVNQAARGDTVNSTCGLEPSRQFRVGLPSVAAQSIHGIFRPSTING